MLKGKLVLVVDDDKELCRLIASVLRDKGANVMAANSVKEAAGQLLYFTFDLIIMDMNLPDGNGHDLLMMIRQAHLPAPVIAMSGAFDALMAVQEGGFDYRLEKPFESQAIVALAEKLTQVPVQN